MRERRRGIRIPPARRRFTTSPAYVCGIWERIGSNRRTWGVAEIDSLTGQASSWMHDGYADSVTAIGGTLYVGSSGLSAYRPAS